MERGLDSWPFWSPRTPITAPDPRDQPVARRTASVGPDCPSWGCKSPHKPRSGNTQGYGRASEPLSGRRGIQTMHGYRGTSMPPGPDPAARPLVPATRHHCLHGQHRPHAMTTGQVSSCPHITGLHWAGCEAGRRQRGVSGTQSKQEERRFHTPNSRQWTEGRNGAGKGPQVQGWVASPPSGFWFALSQART